MGELRTQLRYENYAKKGVIDKINENRPTKKKTNEEVREMKDEIDKHKITKKNKWQALQI